MSPKVEDPNDYENVQSEWEASHDNALGDPEIRPEDIAEPVYGKSTWVDDPTRLLIGESTTFRLKYPQPCGSCGVLLEAGTAVVGRKEFRGWTLWHPDHAPNRT